MNWPSHWRFLAGLNSLISRHRPKEVTAVLEWGAGSSTILLHNAAEVLGAQLFVSIEEHREYLDKVSQALARDSGIFKALAVPCSDSAFLGPEIAENSLCYSSAPLVFRRQFDVVFVDGRTRAECLLTAAALQSREGFVLLHDFRRTRYDVGRFLFDVVDEYMGLQVLKRKQKFEFLARDCFKSLSETVSVYSDKSVGLQPGIDPLSVPERVILSEWAQRYLKKSSVVLEWASVGSTQVFSERAKQVGVVQPLLSIVASSEFASRLLEVSEAGGVEVESVSVKGSVRDHSRDPNLHYSTSPVSRNQRYDFVYIGGERRSECLLTAAFLLDPEGVVILRRHRDAHLQVGLRFFELIEENDTFGLLRLKTEMKGQADAFLESFYANHEEVQVTPAEDEAERQRDAKSKEAFLRRFQ